MHTFNPNTQAGLHSMFQDSQNNRDPRLGNPEEEWEEGERRKKRREGRKERRAGGGRGGNPSRVYPATRVLVNSRCGQGDKQEYRHHMGRRRVRPAELLTRLCLLRYVNNGGDGVGYPRAFCKAWGKHCICAGVWSSHSEWARLWVRYPRLPKDTEQPVPCPPALAALSSPLFRLSAFVQTQERSFTHHHQGRKELLLTHCSLSTSLHQILVTCSALAF